MEQHIKDGLPFFQFSIFPDDGVQRHAVFTRQGGLSPAPFASLNLSVSVPDSKENVYANRTRAYGLFGRDTDSVVHSYLVHGADVARVTRADDGTWIPKVDGIMTDEPGCALTMNFADCTPILLYDPHRGAIAIGHSGWKACLPPTRGTIPSYSG